MSSKSRDRKAYLKQYPQIRKWLNECLICHSIGYKPEMPENINPGLLANNIRSLFSILEVNEFRICKVCAKHWNDTKIK